MGIWRELRTRRVPHALGVYLGASWAVLEFVSLLVSQFVLSPHLVTFCLVVLTSLTPSVAVVSFFHARSGRQGWERAEKIAVPLNLGAMAMLLVVLFGGKDLGAATTTVSVVDDEGTVIERQVPKEEFVRRMAIFAFRNETGDPDRDWLQLGLPHLVFFALNSHGFIRTEVFFEEQQRSGAFEVPSFLPLAQQWDLARKSLATYSVTGSLRSVDGGLEVSFELYETRTGRKIDEGRLIDADPLVVAGQLATQVVESLDVPAVRDDERDRIPIREQLSASDIAVESFLAAAYYYKDRGNPLSEAFLLETLSTDSTFALAAAFLGQWYLDANQLSQAERYFDQAERHAYRLIEAQRWVLRVVGLWARGEVDEMARVVEVAAELFPSDAMLQSALARAMMITGEYAAAVRAFERVYQLDPASFDALGELCEALGANGEITKATELNREYATRFPARPHGFRGLGSLAAQTGDLGMAVQHYERALILDPEDVASVIMLGELSLWQSRTEETRQYANSVLTRDPSNADAVDLLVGAYLIEGVGDSAIASMDALVRLVEDQEGQLMGDANRGFSLGTYARFDRARADAILDTLRGREETLLDFSLIGEAVLSYELGDQERFRRSLPGLETIFEVWPDYNFERLYLQAEAARMEGGCAAAVPLYLESQAAVGNRSDLFFVDLSLGGNPFTSLGMCYREMGQYESAEQEFQKMLEMFPNHPQTHYELALLYRALNRNPEALTSLHIALDIWKRADPGYRPAQRARALLAELTS